MIARRTSQVLSIAARAAAAVVLLIAVTSGIPAGATVRAAAQHEAAAQPPDRSRPQESQVAHEAQAGEQAHEEGWLPAIARAVNFAILAAVLIYFLKTPLTDYLTSRIAKVRQDLVTAAEMRETATRQLAEIDARLRALPAELDALKRRGAEEMTLERERIQQAAEAERERLLEQTRREIDMRLRVARRELLEHAADLAVTIASERIKRSITTDDQTRLVERYTAQLHEVRA